MKSIEIIIISIFIVYNESIDYTRNESETEESDIVIEGGIITTRSPVETLSAAVDLNRAWPNALIPYKISEDHDEAQQEEVKMAMEEFEMKTCVRFTERKNEKQYINIVKSVKKIGEERNGCYSRIGFQGKHNILLGDTRLVCPRTVKHLLMHAVGFPHEHSHSDRDDYLKIYHENITDGEQHNFDQESDALITGKDGFKIERKEDFSRIDILDINRLYKCKPGNYTWEPSDNGQIQLAENCSFFGKDIHHEKCSSEECAGLCLANSLCTHFTNDLEGALCGYINQRISVFWRDGDDGKVFESFFWRVWDDGKLKWAPRCDFWGLNFYQEKIGYIECGKLCFDTQMCTHFTWDWKGICYLKSLKRSRKTLLDLIPRREAICGYVNRRDSATFWQDGENGQVKFAKGCDFFRYDFLVKASKDLECGGFCLANHKCTHFTWNPNDGSCHLKEAPDSAAFYGFEGGICGFVTQRNLPNIIWQSSSSGKVKWTRNCDYFSYTIGEKESKEEECSTLCLANPKCTHFTWYSYKCYMKNAPKSVKMYGLKGALCGYTTQHDDTDNKDVK